MKIEVLGGGCRSCEKLEAATRDALAQLDMVVPIEKVTDYAEIVTYGVMSTPALSIDGEVKVVGRIPSVEELKELIAGVAS